jgi:hypothetical protein
MFMRELAQESNLFSVAAAPCADRKVKTQSKPLWPGEQLVEGIGLQPADKAAIGQERAVSCLQGRSDVFE